nr:protein argonaute 4A [Tanacetum cinerariifolium]
MDVTKADVNNDVPISALSTKIIDMERQLLDGKLVLVDDDGVSLKPMNIDFPSVSEMFGTPNSLTKDVTADLSANTQESIHGVGVTKVVVGDELHHTVEAMCFTKPNPFMGGFQEAGECFDTAMKKVLTQVLSSVVVEDTVKDSNHQGVVPSNTNEANEASQPSTKSILISFARL